MPHYDVLIVGAGIAGPALAHGLSTLPRAEKPRIALVERSLAEPDRIVGELLQPGGVIALRKLGLEGCLEGFDAIPIGGYCVINNGKSVHIPYPTGYEGRGFHHGRFVMSLRAAAKRAEGVDLIEATVTDLIEEAGRVVGVKMAKKCGEIESKEEYRADIVIIADGCFSNFRGAVMGRALAKPVTKSHFCGAILEDVALPIPRHGTVALIKGSGPVLMYQISKHDTRILFDVKQPLPADLKVRSSLLSCLMTSHGSLTVSYSYTYRSSTSLIPPYRHLHRSRQAPSTTYAQLLPASCCTRIPRNQSWRYPHW